MDKRYFCAIISISIVPLMTIREIVPGRLLFVDVVYLCNVVYKNCILRIINVYTSPERVGKMRLFRKLVELLCGGFPIILCGDFNTVTDVKDRIP